MSRRAAFFRFLTAALLIARARVDIRGLWWRHYDIIIRRRAKGLAPPSVSSKRNSVLRVGFFSWAFLTQLVGVLGLLGKSMVELTEANTLIVMGALHVSSCFKKCTEAPDNYHRTIESSFRPRLIWVHYWEERDIGKYVHLGTDGSVNSRDGSVN